MENRILFLDADGNMKGAEALTLPELQSSYQAERFNTRGSFTKPVEHFVFIDKILRLAEREQIQSVMKKVFINKRDVQLMKKKDEDVAMTIDNLRVDRLVGRIIYPQFTNDTSEYSLAYGYSDKGFELAFGLNVKVCQNLSIFASKIYRTYGPNRITLEEIMTRLIVWYRNLEVAWQRDNFIVEALMNEMISLELRNEIVSEVYYRSLKTAEGDPFNQGEAKAFTLKVMEEPSDSLWEVYNHGTNILHPKNIGNTERVLSMNEAFGFYLLGKFPTIMGEVLASRDLMEGKYLESIS
jgi:hypothetical protein